MSAPTPPGPLVGFIWMLWIVGFVAVEFYGLGNPASGDTLTETTAYWASLHLIIKVALSLFWLWLPIHMLSRYWFRPVL